MQKSHKYLCVLKSGSLQIDGMEVMIQVGDKCQRYKKFSYVEPVREDADPAEKFWHERFLVSRLVRIPGNPTL